MAGQSNAFGALSFKHVLRNYILGCGEIVPQPKNSSVSFNEDEDGTSGFEAATIDLVEATKIKGKVIVTNVNDGDSEMLDIADIVNISDIADTESLHFEIESNDAEFNQFIEQCGMCKFRKISLPCP